MKSLQHKRAKQKTAALGLAAVFLLSGCSGFFAKKNTAAFVDTTITGTVESVEDDTVTLSLNTMGGGMGMGSMPNGQIPPDGTGGGDSGADASEGGTDVQGSDSAANGSGTEEAAENSTNPANADSTENNGSSTDNAAENSANGDENSAGESTASDNAQTPPEKPEGDAVSENGNVQGDDGGAASPGTPDAESGSAPSVPEGAESGSAPSIPEDLGDGTGEASSVSVTLTIKDTSVLQDESGEEKTLEDIEEGSTLTVTFDEDGAIASVVIGNGSAFQDLSGDGASYTAIKEIAEDETLEDETYTSEGTDENAIWVSNGASASLTNITAERESEVSEGGDNASFYGVGADVLVTDGTATISGGSFTTSANGGAGLFAYGDGVIYADKSRISTSQDTSGGVHVAGGGTLYGWDLSVETAGASSAAVRSDRGGGTMVLDGGSYASSGTGSPAVYCTAEIAIHNAALSATGSEAVCLEGKNSLHLFDCDLSGAMADSNENDSTWNVILYQSTSGDAEEGNGTFEMVGGSLTAANGGMFYTTNTESTFLLSNVDITYAEGSEYFLRCTGNANARGWGESGSNGADCTFTADNQDMEGNVIYDSISHLQFYMVGGSTLTGAFLDDETYAGSGGDGTCTLTVSEDSTWIVTENSTVTNLNCAGQLLDESGRRVSVAGTDGTVYVQGDSAYTVTVSAYSETADTDGAMSAGTFDGYAVEKPL